MRFPLSPHFLITPHHRSIQVLEFHGVMRFYFQEPGEKITTKCIRISSSATTRSVLAALIEKFHPDMKMLGMGNSAGYSIWEAHESGRERELGDEEHPLVVQLGWHNDDIEGRFLLRRRSDAMSKVSHHPKGG
jgi:afadin